MQRSASDAPESSPTPDRSHRLQRKRKRNVLSCLDCRRRKVKCDHGLPACGRCKQRGTARSCTYKLPPEDEPENPLELVGSPGEAALVTKRALNASHLNTPNESMATEVPLPSMPAYSDQTQTISHLEDRLRILESLVAHSTSLTGDVITPSRTAMMEQEGEIPIQPKANLFRGRGFRTQFHGASSPISLIASVCLHTSHSHRRLITPVSGSPSDHERSPSWFIIRASSERLQSSRSKVQEQ
jgi:hypothetical protein